MGISTEFLNYSIFSSATSKSETITNQSFPNSSKFNGLIDNMISNSDKVNKLVGSTYNSKNNTQGNQSRPNDKNNAKNALGNDSKNYTKTDNNSDNNINNDKKAQTTDKHLTEKSGASKTKKTKETTKLSDMQQSDTPNEELVLQEIAKILSVTPEKLQDVLSILGISQQQLSNQENLVEFIKLSLDVESNMELLSIDGIKDIVSGIKNITEENFGELSTKSIENTNSQLIQPKEELKSDSSIKINNNNDDVIQDFVVNQNMEIIDNTNSLKENNVQNTEVKNISESIPQPKVEVNNNLQQSQVLVEDISNQETTFQEVNEVLNISNIDKVTDKVLDTQSEPVITTDENTVYSTTSNINHNSDNNQQNFNNNSNNQEFNQDFDIDFNYKNINNIENIQNENVNFTQSIHKTEISKNVDRLEIIKQISEQIKVGIKGELTEVSFTLRPDHLGDVVMKVATQNGIVTAQFIAENQRVKEIIESNFTVLRDMIAEQGIQVQNLGVSLSNDGSNNSNFNFQQGSNNKGNMYSSNSYVDTNDLLEDPTEISYVSEDQVINSQINYSI